MGNLVIANLHPAVSAEAISSRVFCFSLYQREIKRDFFVVPIAETSEAICFNL